MQDKNNTLVPDLRPSDGARASARGGELGHQYTESIYFDNEGGISGGGEDDLVGEEKHANGPPLMLGRRGCVISRKFMI